MAEHDRDLSKLATQAAREPLPAWDPRRALPWAELDFSTRVLNVHLDPDTPAASRGPRDVALHIDWLEPRLGPGPVLDLCCGPGLYCHELARRGCRAVGVDIAPAAIAWARMTSASQGLGCTFLEADLAELTTDLVAAHAPFAAITCWFGDFHNFPRETAARLLATVTGHLAPGGLLVLEMQPWADTVREDALSASTVPRSMFCDQPHHWVQRLRWDEATETEIHGHWIGSLKSGTLHRYSQCLQAWRPDRLEGVLAACSLEDPEWYDPIVGLDAGFEFPVLVARRVAAEGGR